MMTLSRDSPPEIDQSLKSCDWVSPHTFSCAFTIYTCSWHVKSICCHAVLHLSCISPNFLDCLSSVLLVVLIGLSFIYCWYLCWYLLLVSQFITTLMVNSIGNLQMGKGKANVVISKLLHTKRSILSWVCFRNCTNSFRLCLRVWRRRKWRVLRKKEGVSEINREPG